MTKDGQASFARERADDPRDPHGIDLKLGDVVAERYRVEHVIGQGASGIVHLARTLDGDKPVALKVIHRELCGDKQIFGRYRREASILRRLENRNIVAIYDFIEHDGLLIIVLEYVDGTSLEATLTTPIEIADAVEIALQITAGLASAHAAGVIHRDLKPANIMIEPRGWPRAASPSAVESSEPRVRILDFGLAKVLHGEHMTTGLTEHDMIFGTPEYMAPEQARGDELDVRCDVYATGVLLYEMTTGRVPFSRRTPLATMTAQLTEAVVPPRSIAEARNIPPALEAVIMRALEKDRDDRYGSAEELSEALLATRRERVLSVRPSSPGAATSPEEMELGETDLAIRVSQVLPERRATADSRAPRTVSAPPPEEPTQRGLVLVAIVVGWVASVVGVLLASR